MKSSSLKHSIVTFVLLVASIIATHAAVKAQGTDDKLLLELTDANQEVDIPADTHVYLRYLEGENLPIDQGTEKQGEGKWLVYRFDGTEPPFEAPNYFLSAAYKQNNPGDYGLKQFLPYEFYYIRTDTQMTFSPQTGLYLNAVCGNGIVEDGESCDSVNGCSDLCKGKLGYWCDATTNSCSFLIPSLGGTPPKDCEPGRCEDGTKYPRCDADGNVINYVQDPCNAGHPSAPVCGNGDPALGGADTDDGEECDDGNLLSGDGCSGDDHPNAACTVEFCGDGYLDEDGILTPDGDRIWKEECDDGGYCFKDGVAPWPENAMRDEQGNPIRCTTMGWPDQSQCGEGAECTVASFDGCTSDCKIEYCGDGVFQPFGKDAKQGTADDEQCDDKRNDNGDGCSETCAIEEGWKCDGAPTKCVRKASSASSSSSRSLIIDENLSSSARSSAVSSSVSCNADANLQALFAGKTSLTDILNVPKAFVQRVKTGLTTPEDDVNCDGVVDGITEGKTPPKPSGDFKIIVDYATQLLLK